MSIQRILIFVTACSITTAVVIATPGLSPATAAKETRSQVHGTDALDFDLSASQRYGYEGSGDCGNDSEQDREWINDQYKDLDFDPDGSGEIMEGVTNPSEIPTVSSINNEAIAETEKQYPGGSKHNNEADAFRHAYFNARLTQELGADRAKEWGDAHEISSPNPVEERVMDLNNNRAGREVGEQNPTASPGDIAKAVRDEISKEDSSIMTSPPNCGGDAGGEGDPHLTGFDGSRFDFHGEHGKQYVLFGHPSGDILTSKMREASWRKTGVVKHTYFDAFGLQIGETEHQVTVSLEKDVIRDAKWRQVVRLNGQVIAENVKKDGMYINLRRKSRSVTVTTNTSIFTFRARVGGNPSRHQDVSVSLRRSPQSSGGYLGILGMTLNRAISSSVHSDFLTLRKSIDLEMNLRRHFEVDSLFPRIQTEADELNRASRMAVSALTVPMSNHVAFSARVVS